MLPGSLAAFAAFERDFPECSFRVPNLGTWLATVVIAQKNGESGCFISSGRWSENRSIKLKADIHSGIGPDRNKIETAHGLSVSIFCSNLNL